MTRRGRLMAGQCLLVKCPDTSLRSCRRKRLLYGLFTSRHCPAMSRPRLVICCCIQTVGNAHSHGGITLTQAIPSASPVYSPNQVTCFFSSSGCTSRAWNGMGTHGDGADARRIKGVPVISKMLKRNLEILGGKQP